MATQKNSKKWLIYGMAGLVLLLIAGAIYKSKTRNKGTEIEQEKVQRRDIVETVSASGKIYPETEIKISSDVSGEVVELYVKEGDSVKAGQLLARIDPDVYQTLVERGEAALNTARSQSAISRSNIESSQAQREQISAQLKNAKKMLERNMQLKREGIISDADLETSKTQVETLEANLRSAEAAISSAKKSAEAAGYSIASAEAGLREQKTNLGRTTIKAPAGGIISKLNVERGERVVGTVQMTGTEMMRIADLQAMEVRVEVSENDIIRVNLGNEAIIDVDAYLNKKFKGRVTEISNSTSGMSALAAVSNDQVAKFEVRVRIDKDSYSDLINSGKKVPFKPGMSATVRIKTNATQSTLSVPIQSVTAYDPEEERKKLVKNEGSEVSEVKSGELSDNIQYKEAVFVVKGDTVARLDVTTGIQDDEYIEINTGLTEEDIVVSGPYSAISKTLKSGSKVYKKQKEKKKNDD